MIGLRSAALGAAWCTLSAAAAAAAPAPDCTPAEVSPLAVDAAVYLRATRHGDTFRDRNVANAGFVIGERCVAVIDSGGAPGEGEALRCAIAAITDVPVCYLILTHHHPDHALGATAFKSAGAEIIGHDNLGAALNNNREFYRQRFAEAAVELDPDDVVLPDRSVAVGAPLTLDLGGRELRLTAHRPAHTDNDLSVYDPHSGLLWLGDLLFREHVPALEIGSKGWLAALDELARVAATLALPGHGPPLVWPQPETDTGRYLRRLREDIGQMIDDGATLQHAYDHAAADERDRWQLFDRFHRRNVGRVFTEMEWE